MQIKQDIPKQQQKNSTCKQGVNASANTNNQMTRKQNNFGAKYGNKDNIKEKPNGWAILS